MNTNQQFAVSCHILAVLAAFPHDLVTSEVIAESVDTNPVVIRRVLALLRARGLVDSRSGANGGWRLAYEAEKLSLRDVYHAVSHEALLATHQHPNSNCPIGSNILSTLDEVFDNAEQALELALQKFTVADVLHTTLHKNIKISERSIINHD